MDKNFAQCSYLAIASFNWSQPENQDEMPVDYYELTLVGSHINFSLSVCMIDQLQQMVSYKHVVPEGNYTAASITAVDLCGQRSKPPEVILTNITMDLLLVSNVPTSDTEQS